MLLGLRWWSPASAISSTDSPVGSRFGEEGRQLSYGTYLKVSKLLGLQQGLSEAHDELLLIVARQVYELWFKVVLDGSRLREVASTPTRSTLGKRFFPDLWEVRSQL